MVAAVFDTCILIDYLNEIEAAKQELALYDDRAISMVSWMEVLAGCPDGTEVMTRQFLSRFKLIPVSPDIAEVAVIIRRKNRLKLPDAIIQATAETLGRLLVTRDEKAFGNIGPSIRIPYSI